MPLGVTAIDHVSVLITDLAKARWFYRDVLGLPEIAKPKTFDFVTEELPKNASGKLQRRMVRERYWEGHDRRVG